MICSVVEVYLNGEWVDISTYVRDHESPIESSHGRKTVLQDPDSSTMSLTLDDSDHRFTPGNTASEYYPYFDAGAPIRWTETIDDVTIWNYRGVMEMPQATIRWDDDENAESYVTVSCVDLMTSLDRAPAFESTLAAYILNNTAGVLQAFWPLTDAALPFMSLTPQGLRATATTDQIYWGTPDNIDGEPSCSPRRLDGPPGDDGRVAEYDIEVDTFGTTLRPGRSFITEATIPTGILPLAAGQVVTVVAWVYSEWKATATESGPLAVRFVVNGGATGYLRLRKQAGENATWQATLGQSGTLSSTVAGGVAPSGRWTLVALRFGYTSNHFELWVDDNQYVGTVTGSAPTTVNITGILMPEYGFDGGLAYVQVYIGAAADWGFTRFQAQRQAGLTGLERQTAGDRIATIAEYANVDPADLNIEASPALMQVARLAGVRPGAAMRNAANTDQGILCGSPDGRVMFQSRMHRYYNDTDDPPVEIPYEWLSSPLIMRRDRPINVAAVDAGGPTATATDEASRTQWGEGSFEASLDSACDSDPQALAAFMVDQYGRPRSRLEWMSFVLDHRTDQEQILLLSLGIGDRILVTGAPDHWPEGTATASIEGRKMSSSNGIRILTLNASPIVGLAPGVPGPWFRLGTSALGGSDILSF